MRAVLLLMPVLAFSADLKVDHVTIAGNDLDALSKTFASAGIPVEFGGKHTNGMTEMALSSFPDGSYIELIAPQKGADVTAHYWGPFMTQQAGPCAWAIRTTDMSGDVRRLQAAGIYAHPQKSGRKRADGVELKWETANVGPGAQGSFFPFLIADETPRERRAYPKGKPTTAKISGVKYVVVAVRDLPGAIAKYRAAFALPEPRRDKDASLGAELAWFEGTPAILAAPLAVPLNDNAWLPSRLKQFGEAPCIFVLGSSERWQPTGGRTKWFDHEIAWLDSAHLAGARIGISSTAP
jgi:hypothetical protein